MSLGNIKGHNRQINILKGLIRKNRLPSSFIFSGDMGIGKMTTALNLFKAINCMNSQNYDSCDTCLSCRKIDSQNHPDLLTLQETDKEIKVDVIRRLEEFVFTRPYEGRMKAVVIDRAHHMNEYAQNAFLKTLEEPPSYCIFLMITHSYDALLDTIKSRCFHLRFTPLSKVDYLEVLHTSGETKLMPLFSGRPGMIMSGEYTDTLEGFYSNLNLMLQGETKERWKDSIEMRSWLEYALVYLRDMAVYAADPSKPWQMLDLETNSFPLTKLIEIYDEVLAVLSKIDYNLNKKIVWNYMKELITELK